MVQEWYIMIHFFYFYEEDLFHNELSNLSYIILHS